MTHWSRDVGLQPCQGRAEMGKRRHLGPDGGRGISLYIPFLTQVWGGGGHQDSSLEIQEILEDTVHCLSWRYPKKGSPGLLGSHSL